MSYLLLARGAARLALLGSALAASACDGGFRVQGELVTSASPCRMRLHDAKDGKVFQQRAVRSGSFEELFTISPVSTNYYLTIACDGVTQSFKSATVRLGGRRYYDYPLKLGRIVVGAEPKRD